MAAEKGTYLNRKGVKVGNRGLMPRTRWICLAGGRGLPVDVPRGGRMDWKPLREKIRSPNAQLKCPGNCANGDDLNITGTSPPSSQPTKNLFVKSNLSGEFLVLNPFLVEAKS